MGPESPWILYQALCQLSPSLGLDVGHRHDSPLLKESGLCSAQA